MTDISRRLLIQTAAGLAAAAATAGPVAAQPMRGGAIRSRFALAPESFDPHEAGNNFIGIDLLAAIVDDAAFE